MTSTAKDDSIRNNLNARKLVFVYNGIQSGNRLRALLFMILGLFHGPWNVFPSRDAFVHSVAADLLTDLAAFSVITGSDVVQAGAEGTLVSACL